MKTKHGILGKAKFENTCNRCQIGQASTGADDSSNDSLAGKC